MTRFRRVLIHLCLAAGIAGTAGEAAAVDWGALAKSAGIGKTTTLADTKIGSGIREALKTGIDKAIELTGRKDGYLANPQIKIPMPEKAKLMESLLRKVGMGSKVDELVTAMNRAAEAAAPQAKDIFVNALMNTSLQDAEALLKGGDTAATDYFRKTTSGDLTKLYRPIVEKNMAQYAVGKQYQMLASKYQTLPFAAKMPLPRIEDYTVQKALDGLFLVMGQQEKEIRSNPQAQASALLRDVFGGAKP